MVYQSWQVKENKISGKICKYFSISRTVTYYRKRRTEHVDRMQDTRIPKQALQYASSKKETTKKEVRSMKPEQAANLRRAVKKT